MEEELKQFLEARNIHYHEITDPDTLDKIHNLFINNQTDEYDPTNSVALYYYGVYYHIIDDKDKMCKYYLKAIECDNAHAMFKYARWCEDNSTRDNVKKYYLMAIDHKHDLAMFNYALWCERYGTRDDANKYYLMAIEYGNAAAMNNYAISCDLCGSNADVKKYYLMAIDHGCIAAMNNYAIWCEHHGTKEDIQKYYLMAIDNGYVNAMYNYGMWCYDHNYPNYKKYFILGCKNNHSECRLFINNHFLQHFLPNINDVYDYLTDANKIKVNDIVAASYQLTNINIINESLCLTCQLHTKCLFLLCGHPQCFKCWPTKCTLCDPPIFYKKID